MNPNLPDPESINLSIPFMGYLKHVIYSCLNFLMLSIPFMGYIILFKNFFLGFSNLSIPFMGYKKIPFSISFFRFTFNSLYGILKTKEHETYGWFTFFQFPLWDT